MRSTSGKVFTLALKDLRHEWTLSLCVIMALAAVLAPLLILFGLKYGIIETLRHQLMEDPLNRELRPMTLSRFDDAWFDHLKAIPETDFVIPSIRQIAASGAISFRGKDEKDKRADVELIPTGPGDPLILENQGKIPDQGECALSWFAAEETGARAGDTITLEITRRNQGQIEKVKTELKVTSQLNVRASSQKYVFLPLSFLSAVEEYKDGRAVPEFGWPGSIAKAFARYDGLVVLLSDQLDGLTEKRLTVKTGFTVCEKLLPDTLKEKTGISVAGDGHIYYLGTKSSKVGMEHIKAIQGRLRGKEASFIPVVEPIPAEILTHKNQLLSKIDLIGLSVYSNGGDAFKVTPSPPWGTPGPKTPPSNLLKVILPDDISLPDDEDVVIRIKVGESDLTFPIHPVSGQMNGGDKGIVPAHLAGVLNLGRDRSIIFDPDFKAFILNRLGYSGFRLYARSIDDVEKLKTDLEKEGLNIHSEAGKIIIFKDMDRYFTLIFWLIASVGIAGGLAALIANLYASVERKKREIGVLRLLGLSGAALFGFPVYQGLGLAAGGFIVAMVVYTGIAMVINYGFPDIWELGNKVCYIPWFYVAAALFMTLLIAMLSAVVASFRVTKVQAAEALRDE